MGKAVLIILLSSGIMFSIASLNTNKILEQATSKAIDYHSQIRARNIANSMVGIALSKLSDDNDWRVTNEISKNLLDGNVNYTVTDKNFAGENLIQISAEATYFGMTKKVIAYTKVDPASASGPPFFSYAILAGDDFRIDGANNNTEDDVNPLWNSNTHSNAETELTCHGENYLQEGFLTYTTNFDVDWGEGVTISPNQNPGGDPTYSFAPAVTIPPFSAASYIDDADEVYNGDKTYSGTITMGTKDNPKIIYVGGVLSIQGTVTGYGVFIVKGEILIVGDLLLDTPDPTESKLALYTDSTVTMDYQNSEVHAQIFAQDRVTVDEDGIEFHGSITAGEDVRIKGDNIDIYYKPASRSLMVPFFEVGGGGRLAVLYYNEQ